MDKKEKIREILVKTAKKGDTIAYSALAIIVNLHHNSKEFDDLLYAIAREDGPDKPILTSLVVYRGSGGRKAGPGFRKIAQEFGRDVSDIEKCLLKEQHAVRLKYRGF